jgi:hypothetical protein
MPARATACDHRFHLCFLWIKICVFSAQNSFSFCLNVYPLLKCFLFFSLCSNVFFSLCSNVFFSSLLKCFFFLFAQMFFFLPTMSALSTGSTLTTPTLETFNPTSSTQVSTGHCSAISSRPSPSLSASRSASLHQVSNGFFFSHFRELPSSFRTCTLVQPLDLVRCLLPVYDCASQCSKEPEGSMRHVRTRGRHLA